MGIFNFFKKRKEKRYEEQLAEAQRIRENYQTRKKLICDFIDSEYKRRAAIREKMYDENVLEAQEVNSVCPLCGSKNVINLIKRPKGEIHGSKKAHASMSLTSYSYDDDFNIDGKLDTYPVNKCKNCQNEWPVKTAEYVEDIDPFSSYWGLGQQYLSDYTYDFANLSYDPFDKTEEYASLADKANAFLKRTQNDYFLKEYKTAPREVIEYVIYNSYLNSVWDDDMEAFYHVKISDDYDKYSYQLPDNVWEIVKKILGRND